MLILVRSRQFKRDVRKAEQRGKNMNKLLIEEKPLPRHYYDHPLKGDWVGCHESGECTESLRGSSLSLKNKVCK
ncbi:type II toxin-antitoxin system YafQ family toxin [Bartonella rattimassiliensis]|uniref:RelE/StbE family addiction module toxin n=1 Tax=Bartonella rattimassiliensis 15908 TaxID=1094556 RepID=J1JDW1_9HYPH|nr:type II toxin-antitoxin system mRNA interferase toxin, RelE/StbE family [Bartonella rattimassiliensis]EJF82662.1 RelE/StbE family addiction module toxin [Bartonella rattimassiliensis 15908]